MKYRFFLYLLIFSALFSNSLFAQKNQFYNASEIKQAINKLNVLGSVLYLAAHPDDENTRLITYFSKEKLYKTGYLSLTRGDGGQNLIGSELNENLGVIRTQELLAARRIDGGQQFFTRAKDFGFSKNPDETFSIWDREQVLADVVWVIRSFQPDVIVTRFNTEPGRTHGHHTASAILALEAFDAAADPNRFPEQLIFVDVWKVKRVVWNTNSWFYQNQEEFKAKADSLLKIDVGQYNELLGKSFTEIAAESRSMHKSQGFGTGGTRGTTLEYLEHLKGEKAKSDLFENINTTWSLIPNSTDVQAAINKLITEFNEENPAGSIPQLLQIRKFLHKLPDSKWKRVKLAETEQIIHACSGLYIEAIASESSAIPGDVIKINFEIINRSNANLPLQNISIPEFGRDTVINTLLQNDVPLTFSMQVKIPENKKVSQPYWLEKPGTTGMFRVDNQILIGKPENDFPLEVLINLDLKFEGSPVSYTIPVEYKKTDPVKGEVYRPFNIIPAVFINPSENVLVFADNKPKIISVKVKAGTNNVKGNLAFRLPEGWKCEPAKPSFALNKKGDETVVDIKIIPDSKSIQSEIKIYSYVNDRVDSLGIRNIEYDHIPAQIVMPVASIKVNKIDLIVKGNRVGYITGAGDELTTSLQQIGYQVTVINEKAVTLQNLKSYDVILIGIRAFNTNQDLRRIHPLLLQYVKEGGKLVVQYNTVPNRNIGDALVTDSIGPYPFRLSRDRVTKEDAAVTFSDPKHPLLNYPNKISEKDFEGWVQERGLYFPDQWSDKYSTVVAFNDPGEPSKAGSILYTTYGKGIFIYTSLSWFRELPSGVPGAYRLFANILSGGRK